jgi:hypothetical protein
LEAKCKQNSLYQLRIPDFDLITSIPACHYVKHGLNDTLLFTPDFSGSIATFSYDVIDVNFLASLEKNPRKRRLMTTKQYDLFETKSVLQTLAEGPRPVFMKYKYDTLGRESKEKGLTNPDGTPAQEESQSFLGKYWLYILIAFLVLPNLLGGPEEAAAAGAAGAKK